MNRLSCINVITALMLVAMLYQGPAYAENSSVPVRLVTAHLLPYSIQGGPQPGFMIELVNTIERRLGSQRQVDFLPWGRAQALTKNNSNHIIFPLTRTPEREQSYNWTIKVASIEMVFVTLDGRSLSLAQARQLERISVQQNTPFETFLKKNKFNNLESLSDPSEQHIYLLKSKRSQAWFTAQDLANYALREQPQPQRFVFSETLYMSDVYIATSKNFPSAIASAYRQAFDQMVGDGSFAAIMQRYQR